MILCLLLACLLGPPPLTGLTTLPPSCPSEVFCQGPLLDAVQMSRVFPDSKTFVDMKLKISPNDTLEAFMNLTAERDLTKDELQKFLGDYFEAPGSEFEPWDPPDWVEHPRVLLKIVDPSYKAWAYWLNHIWKDLGRKIKDDVRTKSDLYSIIYLPNPFIVPGGRFREVYYWDSYWIIKGLLHSQMYDTVKGMLSNFNSIIERYGKIPNGGRIYYLMRSQPPLLIPMFDSYMEATSDIEFLKVSLPFLEREFQHWMDNHLTAIEVGGKSYRVAVYRDQSSGPRPESYKEDKNTARYLEGDAAQRLYSQLKTAAESGWDFSVRWLIDEKGAATGNLTNTNIKSIAPVDLNSFICMSAKLLGKFYWQLGMFNKSQKYREIADEWTSTVENVFWQNNSWFDYDMMNNKSRYNFFPSNLTPLWTGCFNQTKKEYFARRTLGYLKGLSLDRHICGVPTSQSLSGEQWDYPNSWPPLQHIFIVGLENTKVPEAQELAFHWAEKWVKCNYEGFHTTGSMFEKYDTSLFGRRGGGGEYEAQLGFGWTNGVILDLMDRYGYRLAWDTWKSRANASLPAAHVGGASSPASLAPILLAIPAFLALLNR